MSEPIELVVFSKMGGPLTKRITLTADGKIASDGSACTMARGRARRVLIDGMDELAALIESLESNQAIALGSLRGELPDEIGIITNESEFRRRPADRCVIISIEGFVAPWKRDDARWFAAHPRRSHRVRDEFPGEFERSDPIDFVVVRQIKPGQRVRAPFTLVECGADALEMMVALAKPALNDDEAAAHTLFDLTQAGGRLIPTVELAELIARNATASGRN